MTISSGEAEVRFQTACRYMGKFGTVICELHSTRNDGAGLPIWTCEIRKFFGKGATEPRAPVCSSELIACGTHHSIDEAATECMVNLIKKLGEEKLDFEEEKEEEGIAEKYKYLSDCVAAAAKRAGLDEQYHRDTLAPAMLVDIIDRQRRSVGLKWTDKFTPQVAMLLDHIEGQRSNVPHAVLATADEVAETVRMIQAGQDPPKDSPDYQVLAKPALALLRQLESMRQDNIPPRVRDAIRSVEDHLTMLGGGKPLPEEGLVLTDADQRILKERRGGWVTTWPDLDKALTFGVAQETLAPWEPRDRATIARTLQYVRDQLSNCFGKVPSSLVIPKLQGWRTMWPELDKKLVFEHIKTFLPGTVAPGGVREEAARRTIETIRTIMGDFFSSKV